MRRTSVRPFVAAILLPSLAACAGSSAPAPAPAATVLSPIPGRRAIVVSFDSFNEQRVAGTIPRERIPAIHALFERGACTDGARAAFPSKTAPGHAALWTGAYGNVTGISANWQPAQPASRFGLDTTVSGYLSEGLRAEPIWITAGAQGLRVVGHHVTQAPEPPGYVALGDEADGGAALRAARARAIEVLARGSVAVFNGYNSLFDAARVITETVAPPREARGWANIARLRASLPPREIAWKVGSDSIFGLLHGDGRYDRALVSTVRDVARGVFVDAVEAAPIDSAVPRPGSPSRPLARHMSEALPIDLADGARVWARWRLFAVDPRDASRYVLAQPELNIVAANRPEAAAAYLDATRGWTGNSAIELLGPGRLGTPIHAGGDGTAEARMLDLTEYTTRQAIAGSMWAWRTFRAEVLLDYFAVGDDTDHEYWGWVTPGHPLYRDDVARRYTTVRERLWSLVDVRLAHLQSLVAGDPDAALFVSGDHGMRATWRTIRPNVVLRQAGLLATDATGRIDLARTKALSPGGEYIVVNRTGRKGGIVPPSEVAAVAAAVERALLAVRDAWGEPIVTRTWRPLPGDSLGIGGPAGGDVYFGLAAGWYSLGGAGDDALGEQRAPWGNHGFPSIDPDMRTVFCAFGDAIPARRLPTGRTIDVAPTAAEWLGIPAPPNAVGVSWLGRMVR